MASPSAPGRSIGDILGDLVHQLQRLVRTEFMIARAEIGGNLAKMRAAAVLMVAGAILLLPALTILLWGVALVLTRAGLAVDIAALLVGVAACAIGVIVLMIGVTRVKSVNLVPEKALDHLQRDVAAVNYARSGHEHAAA